MYFAGDPMLGLSQQRCSGFSSVPVREMTTTPATIIASARTARTIHQPRLRRMVATRSGQKSAANENSVVPTRGYDVLRSKEAIMIPADRLAPRRNVPLTNGNPHAAIVRPRWSPHREDHERIACEPGWLSHGDSYRRSTEYMLAWFSDGLVASTVTLDASVMTGASSIGWLSVPGPCGAACVLPHETTDQSQSRAVWRGRRDAPS